MLTDADIVRSRYSMLRQRQPQAGRALGTRFLVLLNHHLIKQYKIFVRQTSFYLFLLIF